MFRQIVLAQALLSSSVLFAAAYRIDEIVIPDAVAILPEAINNDGIVVGSYYTQVGAFGFTYNSNTAVLEPLTSPGSGWLRPFDINNRGDIVGQSANGGFVWNGSTGEVNEYSNPACMSTAFWGINDTGVVVGDCFNPTMATTAFLFLNGVFDATTPPIDQMGPVRDINNSNQMVSLFSSGMLGSSIIDPLGGYGVNNLGQIATNFGVRSNGVLTPIVIPGATQLNIGKLNDVGQVTGAFFDGTQFRGFIATPIPEPGTAAAFALIGLLVFRKHASRVQ